MNLKNMIMHRLAEDICDYLRLNKNLFFLGGHLNYRTCEGRRYFCYIAIHDFSIPQNFVRRFLAMYDDRTIVRHHDNLRNWMYKFPYSQTAIDIEAIRKKCENYLIEEDPETLDKIRLINEHLNN